MDISPWYHATMVAHGRQLFPSNLTNNTPEEEPISVVIRIVTVSSSNIKIMVVADSNKFCILTPQLAAVILSDIKICSKLPVAADIIFNTIYRQGKL